jgi:hypothetical protein
MKIIKIKQKDLERIINEQIGGMNPIDVGKTAFDFGKSAVNYIKSKFSGDPSKNTKSTPLPFTPENLKSEIQKQGIVHPDVALAQAKWESRHFKSDIFYDNNNLFGMKLAKQRPTTAVGKNKLHGNHAAYNNWQDSVKDYKLWQDSNGMSSLPKETYINKLSDIYCPPPDCPKGSYGKNIKNMLKYI